MKVNRWGKKGIAKKKSMFRFASLSLLDINQQVIVKQCKGTSWQRNGIDSG